MKIIDQSTVSIDIAYEEPTLSSDGSPLTDLAYTSVFYRVNGGPAVEGAKHAASRPSGGATISNTLLVPAPVDARTQIDFWATSTDLAGNSKGESNHVQLEVERLAPAPPANFTAA